MDEPPESPPESPPTRETQNNPNAVEGLQCHFQDSEGDVPDQPDIAKGIKHVMASTSKHEPDTMGMTPRGAVEGAKNNGAIDSLRGGVVIVRKQHSRTGSDSSIEFVAVEDSQGMKLPPISPTTSESSSEEVGLLVRPMTPTTSDDRIASEAENQSVANHTMPSKTAIKHTATNEKLSRSSSTSSDRVFQGTPIQSATSSPILDPCDIIKVVPRPQFPIRIHEGAPPPFSQEAQSRSIHWSRDYHYFAPNPEWVAELSDQRIRETLRPHINHLGYESESVEIEFLSEGGFHRVYTITALNQETKRPKSFVLRIPLPADPYFKTESDVATTEIVRYTTQIPVPVIYAYDSSSNNALGFEWILMEKINGNPMYEYWEKMDYDSKVSFTKLVAGWNTQLANIVSKKIGAIYMHYTATELHFYVGRCVNALFTQENRLSYDVYRGPFETPADFYASVLAITAQDVNDLRRKNRAGLLRDARHRFLDRIWTITTPIDDEEIKDWQEKREEDLETLSTAIQTLQQRLPALCKRLPVVESSNRLSHNDLSLSNVLADENGMPISLLDWESSQLGPMMFLVGFPSFIVDEELPYEPERSIIPSKAKLCYSAEEIEKLEAENEEYYLEKLEIYTKQRLSPEYQAELRRLDSPLKDVNGENFCEKMWNLHKHIIFIWRGTKDIVKWVENQFKPDSKDEFEEKKGRKRRGRGGGGTRKRVRIR